MNTQQPRFTWEHVRAAFYPWATYRYWAMHERQARLWSRCMITYYAIVSMLAIGLLCSLAAMVSQPAAVSIEHTKTLAAEARVDVQATQIAYLQARLPPTPTARYGSGYP